MEPRVTLSEEIGPQGEWTAEMTWYDDDRRGPSQVVIRPTDPDKRPAGGLSSTVLREVDFAAAVDAVRKIEQHPDLEMVIDFATVGGELRELSARGLTDEYLVWLSFVYCAASQEKPDSGPVEYLAEITGKSPAAIKSHLWHASRNGFLIRTPGRRGGQITDKARAALMPPSGRNVTSET
ncbi:hypothetical protein [Mycobacterium noviomagense]|nr:hypothetical protein [Mycobacterium noviomagense]